MTVPFEPERLVRLFEFVAKGLAWHHWGVRIDPSTGTWAGTLTENGVAIFKSFMAQNSAARVEENFGEHTFLYVGVQGTDNPQFSMWLFSIYGGVRLSGDPDAPNEEVSLVGALTASTPGMEKFKAALL
jgi:hypothetical protein